MSFFESNSYSIFEIKSLNKEKKTVIKTDLKKITSKRKKISGLKFNSPQIIGVLNVTPDSFSDGGLFFEESKAFDQVNLMIENGATIIDIGGESTRPGSKTINEKDEWDRIKNIIIKFKKNFPNIPLSLDTRKSYVMKKGIECGVNIINDVSGLNFDKKSFDIIKSKNIPFIECINKSNGTFKNKEDLIKIFERTGLDKSKSPVFTCGSGVTASVLSLAFRLVHDNYSPTIYDGSWSEYGKIG